jgi:ubiquinone/menaquinone biosynthesis C-methylase UbiE
MKNLKTETFLDLVPKDEYLKFIADSKGNEKKDCMWDTCLKLYLSKIIQYKNYEKEDLKYQMQYLVHTCNEKKKILYLNSFIEMLCHFINFNEAINIYNILKNNIKISDLYIIEHMKTMKLYKNTVFMNNVTCNNLTYGMERIRSKVIKALKKTNTNINDNFEYLDLCCGDGRKTKLFASYLKIKNIHGTDIQEWGPYHKNRKLNFDFKLIKNNKLIYDDKSFDIITCFLSLHHIPNLTNMLNEVHRVLKPNGIFFILEHNIFNIYDDILINIQHKLFSGLYDNNMNEVTNPSFIRCFDFTQWDFIIKNTNKFSFISSGVYSDSHSLSKRYDNQIFMIYKCK